MTFLEPRGSGRPGQAPGSVDYRLARRRVLRRVRDGVVDATEVCDAQVELMRVASFCSEPARGLCPICEGDSLRLVRFVFGPRLPRGGRAVSSAAELQRLGNRQGEHRCYVVEVCTGCRWNYLLTTFLLGSELSA